MFILLFLAPIVSATEYIRWQKTVGDIAKSSVQTNGLTTLWSKEKGAQFLYDKIAKTAPLVTVYLINAEKSIKEELQTEFDAIAQECSCYFIDITDLEKRFSTIVTSEKYQIRMQGGDFDSVSGFFKLMPSKEGTDSTPAPTPSPESESTPAPAPGTNNTTTGGNNTDFSFTKPARSDAKRVLGSVSAAAAALTFFI